MDRPAGLYARRVGGLQVKRTVRAPLVVVPDEGTEDVLELPATEDQETVDAVVHKLGRT